MKKSIYRAFTLIELLVVIAIIAILAAILFPVFAQAKLAAKKAVDLSNMKQQGLALMMYHADWDDQMVRTSTDVPDSYMADRGYYNYPADRVYWIEFVYPYVKNGGVFLSPVDPNPEDLHTWSPIKNNSYITNYAAMPAHDFGTVNYSVFGAPADLILIGQRRANFKHNGKLKPFKGTSGFWPGQPCTTGPGARIFNNLDMPTAGAYSRMPEKQAVADLQFQVDDKQNLLNRTYWDIYGNGACYSMADGHAKFMPLGKTTAAAHFMWGEYFYSPNILPGTDPSEPAGSDCD